MGYGIGEYNGKKCQVANHYSPDGVLVGQSLRFPNKKFQTVGKTSKALFGVKASGGNKRIVITEGQIDALAYAEANPTWPVVSIPNGVSSAAKVLAHHEEWLNRFEEIVIAFDNDDAGQEAARECATVFPPGRVKLATLNVNYKDFGEALEAKDYNAIKEAVWNAKTFRPDGVVEGIDLWDTLKVSKPVETFLYPWKGLNEATLGMRKGELVTLTAGTGIGKSAFCREIGYCLIQQTAKVGLLFLEENMKRTTLGMMGIHADEPLHLKYAPRFDAVENKFIEPEVNLDDYREAFDATVGSGNVYLYDHFGSVDMENLLSRIRYMVKACGVDFVILDHLSIVMSGLLTGDERKDIDVAMTNLRTLVEETGAGMALVSHLKRPSGDKGHENGLDPQLAHLRGSHSIGQLSDIVIGLARNQQDEEMKNVTKMLVLKNRFDGETGLAGFVEYSKETGRLSELNQGDLSLAGASVDKFEDF